MSDVETGATRKISVVFERKLGDDNYGGTTARAYLESEVSADATESQIAEALNGLFLPVKAAVLDQLGVEVNYDAETNKLIEVTPEPKVRIQQGGGGGAPQQGGGNGGGLAVANAGWSPELNGPLPQWLLDEAARAGVTKVFDNRAEVQGTKKPHFKEAVARGGSGHGKDGEAKAFWPPR